MNPRLEVLAQTRRLTPTRITDGSEKVRSELMRFMSEAKLNPAQCAKLIGASKSTIAAWVKRDRKCPLFLVGCINFARLQCGLQVEIVPKQRRWYLPADRNGQAE